MGRHIQHADLSLAEWRGKPRLHVEVLNHANLVGCESIVCGSDCGYGTWVGQAAVDPDVMWGEARSARGRREDRDPEILGLRAIRFRSNALWLAGGAVSR